MHPIYVETDEPRTSRLRCNYGPDYDAAIGLGNALVAQFHVAKSHRFGMKLLDNFARM